jgi:hypothetical protein
MGNYKNIENRFRPTEYDTYYWELIPITRIPTLKESISRFAHLNAKTEIYYKGENNGQLQRNFG